MEWNPHHLFLFFFFCLSSFCGWVWPPHFQNDSTCQTYVFKFQISVPLVFWFLFCTCIMNEIKTFWCSFTALYQTVWLFQHWTEKHLHSNIPLNDCINGWVILRTNPFLSFLFSINREGSGMWTQWANVCRHRCVDCTEGIKEVCGDERHGNTDWPCH